MKIAVSLVLFFAASCASVAQAPPAWVTTGKSLRHPQEQYWIGTGFATGAGAINEAKVKAKAAIASQFKVTVSSKMTLVQTEKIVGKSSLMTSDMESRAESMVEAMELSGVEIAETFVSKVDGRTYALAVLEKEGFINTLQTELDKLVGRARQKMTDAAALSAKGDIGTAVNAYMEALDAIEEAGPKAVFFNLVAKGYSLPEDVLPETIESQMRDELSAITLKKISGDGQKGQYGAGLEQPLVVEALSNGNPIRGVPITFKVGETVLEKVITDEAGLAKHNFIVVKEGVRGNKGKALATVDLSKLSSKLRGELRNITTIEFDFTVDGGSAFACDVDVESDEAPDKNIYLGKLLVKALEQSGATVQRDAAVMAKGSLSVSDGGTVNGLDGQRVLQNVTLDIFFVNRANKSVLSSMSVSAKGLGRDAYEGLQKGINALKIPPKELSEAISKARTMSNAAQPK